MEFYVSLDISNKVFFNELSEPSTVEISRILKKLSEDILSGIADGDIKDESGNYIGSYGIRSND